MGDHTQTNGFKLNGNGKRPPLMAELDAAYWVDLPLEMIEHGCLPPFEEHWRVTFATIRCSLCYPHQKAFAVRPRLRSGGFKGWLAAFHERGKTKKPIRPGDLNEEMADTDGEGQVIPISYADIGRITGLSEPNTHRAFRRARRLSLVKEGIPFYANPKPSFVSPNENKSGSDNILLGKLILGSDNFPVDPILRTRALEWASGLASEFKEARRKLYAEYRKRFLAGAPEYSILIPIRGRPKRKETVRPSSSTQEERKGMARDNGRTELLSMTEQSLLELSEAYPHYSPPDNPKAAAHAICAACEWKQDTVTAVFQSVALTLKAGKKVESITGLLVTRARRYGDWHETAAI